jgi:hypothetical protein
MQSRTGSPRCVSPRIGSPRLRSPSPNMRPVSPRLRPPNFARKMSPYERITSPKSINNSILPTFLQAKHPGVDDILKKIPTGRVKTADTSNSDAQNRSIKIISMSETFICKNPALSDLFSYVFDNKLHQDEVLLRVGKIELKRKELACLRPEKLLPINLIDACLSCIKKKNKKMFQKNNTHQRVIIVKTAFAQKVFQSKEKISIRSKKSLLNFEYILFPLFIGYWTLLVVNNREMTARYYDPIGIEKNEVFAGLFDFLRQEISFHQHRTLESTRWKQLNCQRINEVDAFDHFDSAVYVLRMAFKVASNKNITITPQGLNEDRSKLLILLFKYGTKIVY